MFSEPNTLAHRIYQDSPTPIIYLSGLFVKGFYSMAVFDSQKTAQQSRFLEIMVKWPLPRNKGQESEKTRTLDGIAELPLMTSTETGATVIQNFRIRIEELGD